ncbi:MAG: acyltransferase domain-containing protein, partial [Proteobacteria bacterium]|nr:acyltransferase domain-containing protein [Pseudomonadota bacterium]
MKHILKTRRPLIIYNPTLVFDRDYFSACARAGALPVFDMEFFSDEAVREALNALENESFLFGVRIDLGRTALILEMEKGYIPNLDLMVFSYKKKEHLNDFSFSNKHYRFFMEARHIDLNDQFERIDPNGLILKGCEAPGMVSPYTSFILMQWYLANSPLAIFIHGGVGLYTAAGMFAAGVSGLVLDNQLYLCDEAPLDPSYKKLLADVTETDTALVGEALDTPHRFFAKLGTRIVKSLKEKESRLILDKDKDADQILLEDIRENICPLNQNGNSALQSLFYLGQDAAFAKSFIRDSSRLSDVLDLLFQCIRVQIHAVDDHDPLVEDSPLAREHGTRYPVIQGPMANISDNPSFAKTIHDHGGLPFFAMGNLPGDLSETLISEGKKTVPRFGAGLIGIETFNKTIHRHLELLKEYKVPFALFAGGIPSQVKELEQAGTKTYLHTPNMMMLDNAMESGCTRFIFEGTEAGGHVGSLSSFVLWEAAMTRIMAQDDEAIGKQSLIFAGGISSVYASCFISGLASVLSRKKAKIGIQVGSAYLFTKEIVALKGIAPLYQNTLTQSKKTIVTGNTVGLPSRTVPTPFALKLVENEHARIKDGMGLSERKTVFEEENLGSLLISAKGFLPDIHGTNKGKPIRFSDKEQYEKGNFLVGDSLAFLNPGITISQIHDRYFNEKHVLFSHLNRLEIMTSPDSLIYDDIAVIGMGCILPDAPNPDVLWENILSGRYSIRDMPEDRMDPALYVDTDKQAEDKSYTKIAGLVTDFHFDHETYGYTQSQADKISRSQKMILESAFQAVSDAGYLDKDRQFRHDKAGRTGVIIASCLGNEKSNDLHLKSYYPELRSHLEGIDAYKTLPENQKETLLQALKQDMSYGDPGKDPVDGVALHMDALRLARHLKTKGIAYVVDAACATSFTAMDCAMRELLSGRHDTMIVAGNNTNLSPEAFIGFGKMGALSAEGSYPFDQRANGFVLGEGTAVFVLKRLKDAIRQKSAIHGVIKGIGSSSDGKGKAIAAPNPAGQKLALLRCYENIKNPFTVSDIDYIEAHGTSTIMGDQAEIETLKNVYKSSEPIGISSIKSQIGHLLGGAGAAGLLKVLLAMKHRTLPPNGQFQTLSDNMDLSDSPLYIITEPKPWTPTQGKARKAAISSYGFGGINYHVVVEEYSPACPQHTRQVFPETDMDPDDNRIVFVGLGVVLPGAINSDALSKRLPSVMLEPGPMPSDRFALGYYADEPDQVFRLPHIKAGIVDDFKFNNVKYRIPPMAAKSIDRAQLFALDATSQALENSGAGTLLEMGNKIAVILGTVSGKHHAENIFRVRVPYMEKIIRDFNGIDKTILDTIAVNMATSIRSRYPKNTEDTVPGFLSNIVSGRIANFFGCNGANFVVDAGDASSAIAMDVAAMGLRNHDFDLVLTGGVDTNLYPSIMLLYKDMGLLSGNGQSPVMSEGAAVMVMTRLKTAREKGLPILGEYLGASFAMDHGNQGIRPSDEAKKKVENDCFKDMEIVKSRMDTHDSLASGFGLLRSAETAVNIAGTILRKDEASPLYTATSTWALGGLHGHIVTGSLSSRPSIKKSTTLKMDAAKPQKPRVVALLSGQGAQHPFMMKELYDHIPEIRHVMDRGEARFKSARNQSLLDMMFQENEALNLTENTQPAVFLSTAAIFDTLKKQGFSPDYLIGHSVGEFSALYCAGLLDFDQAMDLILTRSSLMKKAADTHPGKIMVVFDSAENTQALIRESGKTVYLANKNSLKQTGVSGETSEIEGFCTFLADKGVVHTKLSLSGAFHSPLFRETGQEMGLYMNNLRFNTNQAHRIISNVNARPYPDQEASIRELLVRQISSPVEFIASVQHVYQAKNTHFIEIGPTRLLANLLKNMDMDTVNALSSVTPKKGQLESFKAFVTQLKDLSLVHEPTQTVLEPKETMHDSHEKDFEMTFNENQGDDFSSFVKNNEEHLKKMLYSEYMKHKKQTAIDAFEKFDFNPGKIVVSGVAVGLPGTGKDVFDPKNFDKLLSGTNFIEPLPASLKELMVDKNVTRLQKDPDGNARFVEITTTEDVIQLAGQLGYFDLDKQYGIKMNYETTIALAMAAGIEALKDAKIPLVMQYKTTSTGSLIADGYALPAEMQDGTGVILSALWPYSETLIREMTHYFYNKFYVKPYEEFEKIYYHLMGNITDTQIKEHVTDWFFRVKERRTIYGDYKMTRDFAHNLTPLGSAHFAQYIRAKGPNIQMSGACASTTQAIGIAEDWIRAGRCERVIIIGGETPTSQAQSQWVGSGFLSLGAASVEKNVENAAKPFDAKRNGTILGSGAVSMIIEREEGALRRGMRGQAEVLGTHIGNTAHHVYNIDVKGISKAMNRFVTKVEKRHSLSKTEYSKNMVFMSHETFTPARGGSADAEITALRTTYPETYRDILITNTKGYTGHTLGAALEDAVLVKVLQKGTAPPIANLTDISEDFKDLRLSKTTTQGNYTYGLHIAAGFGSHLAFAFFKRIEENTVENNPKYLSWLQAVTGSSNPSLRETNNTLMAEAGGHKITPVEKPLTEILEPPAPSIQEDIIPATESLARKPQNEVPPAPARLKSQETLSPEPAAPVPDVPAQVKASAPFSLSAEIKKVIADQTGYDVDMLEDTLDLEADLGIDTVKQVEIFGKISAAYQLKVPENLKL